MGLIINVYRATQSGIFADADCTMNGISRRFNQICLVNVEGPFEPREDCPAAYLAKTPYGHAKIVPAGADGEIETRWTMMGGNYGATSDSRFNQAIEKLTGRPFYGALPIHDRIENQ